MYHKEIDVAAIMREIRKKTDLQDNLGLSALYDEKGYEKVREISRYLQDSRAWIEEKREEAKPVLEMGMRIPAFNMIRPLFRKACILIARCIRKATLHITREQTIVNRRLDECVHELAKSDQLLTTQLIQLLYENNQLLKNEIRGNRDRLERKLQDLQHELNSLQGKSDIDESAADALYVAFENKFRGNPAEIKERMRAYLVPYFERYITDKASAQILDIGCGRGEWLQLLKENGYQAKGLDINEEMVSLCQQQGLDVVCRDAIFFLQQQKEASLTVITGFQIAEHMSSENFFMLLKECHRVLTPGGFILFETPNAHNVEVGTINFYIDPTHVRPLHTEYMRFLAETAGFDKNEIFYWKEQEVQEWFHSLLPDGDPEKIDSVLIKQMAETLRKNFYSSPDYALISFK